MKIYEQAGYTKEEFERLKAKFRKPALLIPDEGVKITPQLYKELKDTISALERRNFTLEQDIRILEIKIALLESQLSKANTIYTYYYDNT